MTPGGPILPSTRGVPHPSGDPKKFSFSNFDFSRVPRPHGSQPFLQKILGNFQNGSSNVKPHQIG
nr:MAG TPA: hypothetical protein [Caudoviricetes sp.]